MSTMLLSASNYTMQVLSSPTRNDIDKAHAKSEHLDIGVLSMRNLARIPKRRLFLFIIMALSSIPIHLFYNSAVFYIGANNQYDIQVVQVDSEAYHSVLRRSIDGSDFEEISDTGWVRAYDNSLVSFGTLVLVVDEYRSEIERITLTGYPEKWPNVTTTTATDWDTGNVTWNMTEPLLFSIRVQTLFDLNASSRRWINLRKEEQVTGPRGDLPRYAHVTRAFATRVNTASRIQLSLTFMIIVIVCNVTKLSTMLWIVSVERKDYIVTLGDGAASFLETPDPSTERLCVLSKPELVREIKSSASGERHNDQLSRLVTQSKQTWTKQSSTYSNALNRDREIGSYFMWFHRYWNPLRLFID
ncbi:hypothetical protein HBH71_117950 [Parastagonospora nodorum]|nr:hypothetical protein HBH71_117950 [Parastagonospora nodorum]